MHFQELQHQTCTGVSVEPAKPCTLLQANVSLAVLRGVMQFTTCSSQHATECMAVTCPKAAWIIESSNVKSLRGKSQQGAQAHHKVLLLWSPPVKRCLPSGVKHKLVTCPVWLFNTDEFCQAVDTEVCSLQMQTVRSSDAEAMHWPSGEHLTQVTCRSVCHWMTVACLKA